MSTLNVIKSAFVCKTPLSFSYIHRENSACWEMRKHPSFPSHAHQLLQEILSLWELLVMDGEGLWCGKNLCLEQCGAMLGDWRVGQCPMLSTSFLVMINGCILSRNSWVWTWVALGIQVPLSGLVVRKTVLEPHGESHWSIYVNRHLTYSSGCKQGATSLPVPGLT